MANPPTAGLRMAPLVFIAIVLLGFGPGSVNAHDAEAPKAQSAAWSGSCPAGPAQHCCCDAGYVLGRFGEELTFQSGFYLHADVPTNACPNASTAVTAPRASPSLARVLARAPPLSS